MKETEEADVKAYKGFDSDMTCRGFQYEEGGEYKCEARDLKLCKKGFHACENPLDCLSYYPPVRGGVYHEVEMSGRVEKAADDSKLAASEIKIGARLTIASIVKKAIGFVFARINGLSPFKRSVTSGRCVHAATSGFRKHAATSGNLAHAVTSGDCANAATLGEGAHAATSGNLAHAVTSGARAHAATSGNLANAMTSGDCAHAVTSGRRSYAATSGNFAHAVASGSCAHAMASGEFAYAVTSGESAHAMASGHGANAIASGEYSNAVAPNSYASAEANGRNAIAAVLGYGCMARGALGCWLVLTERSQNMRILGVRAVEVDGKRYKPNVWYALKDGKVVKARS